jgi:uncharacterized protein YwgA
MNGGLVMSNKAIEVQLCLDDLGVDINMTDFDSRLELQKYIYLVQAFGVDLGFGFSWYLRGPYSSYLADIGFMIHNSGGGKVTDFKLTDYVHQKIQDCKKFISSSKPTNEELSNIDWLELLASLHYLKNNTFEGKKTKNMVELRALLKKKKHWYKDSSISKAIKALTNVSLVNFSHERA